MCKTIHFDNDLSGGICKLEYTPGDPTPDDVIYKELIVKKSGNSYILLKKTRIKNNQD
jgi:hypothetical protein